MSHSTLVYRDLDFSNKTEVLEFLANKLYEEKFVKDGYREAILKREAEYPTALPAKIKIAIPHCDHTLVNKPAIALGILKNKVDFQAMDDPDVTLGVQIVMMLALNEPHGHIEMLQKIISLIQNADDLKKILKSKSNEDVLY
ncbi:PTS sugar transporter subunit IIA, partial [Clostridium saudiense]|nr:PTS sugar transporter subunit IIA [Clostridium saudiense]